MKDSLDGNKNMTRRGAMKSGIGAASAAAIATGMPASSFAQTAAPAAAPAAEGFKVEYHLDVPTKESALRVFDELAYQRAVQVYLWGISAVGMQQYRVANAKAMGGGPDDYKIGYLGGLLKNNIEHLTGNPDSMYIDYMFDTHNGPIVAEVPPTLPGLLDDFWEIPVVDVIPSVSPSGKYLIVPPDWKGEAPPDHVVARPATYVSWMLLRGNVDQTAQGPDTRAAVNEMKTKLKIYPLSTAGDPSSRPQLQFFDVSELVIDRIPPEGLAFFQRLAEVVTNEPPTQTDAFVMGLMKAIGLEPGRPFAPDTRMTAILERAAESGKAMARTISFHGNDPEHWHWPDRKYAEAFMGGSPTFVSNGHTNHDARTNFFYLACATSKLMASKTPGVGQAYPWVAKDADGDIFDGGKKYKMHLPPNIPAKLYWSVTAYDNLTRSELHNGTPFSRISSFTKPKANSDGSFDLFFGPEIPAGQDANWIKTVSGKGWFILFRLYGPEEAYFDLRWKPDDIAKIS
jgi:hypothetical protein